MKLTIHIGSHKTGSTSIQDYCYYNSEYLEINEIYYPKDLFVSYPRQHSSLKNIIIDNDDDKLSELFGKIIEDTNKKQCTTVFLSGEDFSTLRERDVNYLFAITSKYFDEINVVLVLRNKKEYLYSSYKHHLRYGELITEKRFKNKIVFSPKSCVNAWKGKFNNKIILLNYDEIKIDLLGRFFRSVFDLVVKDMTQSNVSLDYLTLLIYNSFIKQHKCKEIDKILWDLHLQFPSLGQFEIESMIKDDIDKLFPIDDWVTPELAEFQYSLLSDNIKSYSHDPVVVCDKLMQLFEKLGEHFRAIKKDEIKDS